MQFRELLERLLDDDDDMRDLNLTAKCADHRLFHVHSGAQQRSSSATITMTSRAHAQLAA